MKVRTLGLGEAHCLGNTLDIDDLHDLVAKLGDLPRTSRAEMTDVAPKPAQQRQRTRECGLGAASHDREAGVPGTGLASGYWGIHEIHATRPQGLGNPPRPGGRDGAVIDTQQPAERRVYHALGAQQYLVHVLRRCHVGEHGLRLGGGLRRAVAHHHAGGFSTGSLTRVSRMDVQAVAGALKMRAHGPAHGTQTDKTHDWEGGNNVIKVHDAMQGAAGHPASLDRRPGATMHPTLSSIAMLIALSPAKTLDFDRAIPAVPLTQPRFIAEAAVLVGLLRDKSPAALATLMSISDRLATLNADRYAGWSETFDVDNSRPAVLAFAGDVYEGLQAATLSPPDLAWAQDHLAILSGLYGVLRPLDLMQPYRLEMGTRLRNPAGADLYAYWGRRIADTLRAQLQDHSHPVLVNLASDEYFSAVDVQALGFRVLQPVFQDGTDGQYKIVSFFAKRARGMMARHAIDHRIDDPEALKDFTEAGYRYTPHASSATRWVFRRDKP